MVKGSFHRRFSRVRCGISHLKNKILSPWLQIRLPCVGEQSDDERSNEEHNRSASLGDIPLRPIAPSPIDLLPAEILGEIFLACLPNGGRHQHHRFIRPEPWNAPMLLCQVCGRWRLTALSIPILWSSISTARITELPQISLLQLWLQRSRASALSFHFTKSELSRGGNSHPELDYAILDTFLSQSHRWENVSIVFNDGLAAQFLALPSSAIPQLRSIKLNVIGCGETITEAFPDKVSTFTNLHRFSFETSQTPGSLMVIQWYKLTHVYVSGLPNLLSSISLLGQCREAIEVQLQCASGVNPPSAFVPEPFTILSNLRMLVMTAHEDVGILLRHFDTPILRYLNILQSSNAPIPRERGAFSDFVERSPHLEEVVVTDSSADEDDILAYLSPIYYRCIPEVLVSSPFATQRIADIFNKSIGTGPATSIQPHLEVDGSIIGWLADFHNTLFDQWMVHQTEVRHSWF